MIINHNIAAMNTLRYVNGNSESQAKSMERLSSGLRINRGADDAAGLSISEKMRAQIKGLDQASRNAQDGVSMIQTADGALNETTSILQRMRELSVQASTDTLGVEDRTAIKNEMGQLSSQIDTIAKTTSFNGKNLLNGDLATTQDTGTSTLNAAVPAGNTSVVSVDVSGAKAGTTYNLIADPAADGNTITLKDATSGVYQSIKITDAMVATKDQQNVLNFDKLGIKVTLNNDTAGAAGDGAAVVTALIGKNIDTVAAKQSADISVGATGTIFDEVINISFSDMGATKLGVNSLNLDDVTNSRLATDTIDKAIKTVSQQRSTLGAIQNRLEHSINNLDAISQNTSTAESRIRDVDMAKEVMNSSKSGILAQAAQAMLAQANQQPQNVLQLLR